MNRNTQFWILTVFLILCVRTGKAEPTKPKCSGKPISELRIDDQLCLPFGNLDIGNSYYSFIVLRKDNRLPSSPPFVIIVKEGLGEDLLVFRENRLRRYCKTMSEEVPEWTQSPNLHEIAQNFETHCFAQKVFPINGTEKYHYWFLYKLKLDTGAEKSFTAESYGVVVPDALDYMIFRSFRELDKECTSCLTEDTRGGILQRSTLKSRNLNVLLKSVLNKKVNRTG